MQREEGLISSQTLNSTEAPRVGADPKRAPKLSVGRPAPRRCSWTASAPGVGEQVFGSGGRRVYLYQVHEGGAGDLGRARYPDFGRDVTIDASDLPAYANGQRYVSQGGPGAGGFSDLGRLLGASLGGVHPQGWRLLTSARSTPLFDASTGLPLALKHDYGLAPLRVRGLERVRLQPT